LAWPYPVGWAAGAKSALINPFTTETYQNTSLTFPIKITTTSPQKRQKNNEMRPGKPQKAESIRNLLTSYDQELEVHWKKYTK